MKIELSSILFIVLLLSGCNEKAPRNIDLTKFLPEENTTRYYYRATVINQPNYSEFPTKDLLMEGVIISRKNYCIDRELYVRFDKWEVEQMPLDMREHIKDNKLKSEDETLCADDEKLTSSGYIFYKKEGNWDIRVESTDVNGTIKDGMLGECHFVDLTKEMIFGKQREVIHTKCMHESHDTHIEQDEVIVEGLGVYKSVIKSDISLDDIKHHSVMTTILEKYE